MHNNCLLSKEEKKKKLHKNIFNRGIFKLIPNDVNKIWRNVYLYDKSNYFKNMYNKNTTNIYKWKDQFIEENNFYKISIKNINKIMNEFYNNIKLHSENSHKYYSRKLTNKEIKKIKNLHFFIINEIEKKILFLNKNKNNNIKPILKETFNNKKIKKSNKNYIYIISLLILFFIIKF